MQGSGGWRLIQNDGEKWANIAESHQVQSGIESTSVCLREVTPHQKDPNSYVSPLLRRFWYLWYKAVGWEPYWLATHLKRKLIFSLLQFKLLGCGEGGLQNTVDVESQQQLPRTYKNTACFVPCTL